MRVRCVVAAVLALVMAHGAAVRVDAAVSISASRTELLYSAESDVDCSKLFAIQDGALLPHNVARLTATADGATDPTQVTYRWSIKKPAGTLAADLDLGPQDQTSAVSGMCADFGNACALTEDRLRFYRERSILWVAPTCDALPDSTSRPFRGGTVNIRVKAFEGRRKLGRASATLGYGRDGSVTLWAWNGRTRQNGIVFADVMEDGIGKGQVPVPLNVLFGATTVPPGDPPGPFEDFRFDNGAGGSATVDPGCGRATTVPLEACATVSYQVDGRFHAVVAARYADGSALCDAITTNVINCRGDIRVDAITRPRRDVYDASDPSRSTVDLTVRVTNTSKGDDVLPPCGLFFEGANVLSCVEDFRAGDLEDSRATVFGLQHCSRTQSRGCNVAADCRPPVCQECDQDETCLTESHCSELVTRTCASDFDCENTGAPAPCPDCKDGESCIRILGFGSGLFLEPGQSFDFLRTTAVLRNELGVPARMRDTWSVRSSLPALSDDTVVRYKIKPRTR